MYYYHLGGAYDDLENNMLPMNLVAKFARSTLGNLGHAKPVCIHQFLETNVEIMHECNKGKISQLKYLGLLPTIDDPIKHYSKKNIVEKSLLANDFCGDYTESKYVRECTDTYLDKDGIVEYFNEHCKGKDKC